MEDTLSLLIDDLAGYAGRPVHQLCSDFGLDTSNRSKQRFSTVTRALLEGSAPKDQVTIKTVVIDVHGHPRQHTSLPAMDFRELAHEVWQSATLNRQLSQVLFSVFRESPDRVWSKACYVGAFVWIPTERERRVLKAEWELHRDIIKQGNMSQLPKPRETVAIHIRPHGRNKEDVVLLPTRGLWIKSSFWLNRSWVADLIRDHLG